MNLSSSHKKFRVLMTITLVIIFVLMGVLYYVSRDNESHLVIASLTMLITLVFSVYIFSDLNQRVEKSEDMNAQLGAIADIYISLHRCDLRTDTITEIRANGGVSSDVNSVEGSIQDVLNKVMTKRTASQNIDNMLAFIDLSTLDERMADTNTLTMEFLGLLGWARARFIVVERENGKIVVFLWMIESIDKEKRRQNELMYLSEIDQMTNILNRGSGEKKVCQMIDEKKYGMLCILDIDRFKSFNDQFGHGVGDKVIKEVARCLAHAYRDTDLVIRFGGDEFAVYAVGVVDEQTGRHLAERFFSEVNMIDIPELNGKQNIAVSLGAAFFTKDCEVDFETLYKHADECTYRSKQIEGSYATFYKN